jgi:hypothetical protein
MATGDDLTAQDDGSERNRDSVKPPYPSGTVLLESVARPVLASKPQAKLFAVLVAGKRGALSARSRNISMLLQNIDMFC